MRKNVCSIGSSSIIVVTTIVAACQLTAEDTSPPGLTTSTTETVTGSSGAGGSATGSGNTTSSGATTSTGTSSGGSTGTGSGGSTGTGGAATDAGSDPCRAGAPVENFDDQAKWANWKINQDGTGTIMPSPFMGSPEGTGSAAHVSGSGFSVWGAGILGKFDPTKMCVAGSSGIKFRAKGTGSITFAAPMKQMLPPVDGGTCMVAADCYNAHERPVTLSANWEEKTILWTDPTFKQPEYGPKYSFNAGDVLQLLFTARANQQPFDFWIDDIALVPGTSGPGPTPVDAGPPGSCVLDAALGQQTFNGWFPGRNAVYTYAGLCTALKKTMYAKFANNGNATADKREVAAFFAHVAWETGNLVHTDQQFKDPATGNYWGRGPLQLTWNYNYDACGAAIGADLHNHPELLSQDPVITWESALWFWLYNDSGKGFTAHDAIARMNFGDTLKVVNSIECKAPPPQEQTNRINNYTRFCSQLGVDPGTQLNCPAP